MLQRTLGLAGPRIREPRLSRPQQVGLHKDYVGHADGRVSPDLDGNFIAAAASLSADIEEGRGYYEDLIHEPLPEEFRKSLNAVSSQERQTGELITPSGEHLKVAYQGSRHTGEPPDKP